MTISNLKLKIGESESELKKIAEKKSGIKNGYFRLVKKSLDARNKKDIFFVYTVEISETPFKEDEEEISLYRYPERVAVIGFGPAGMFCALRLARAGFKPLIIERGSTVDERKTKTERFFSEKVLDEECNVAFGEGGAGTFSDGKLNTGVNGPYNRYVLYEFVKHGAPEEILWLSKPHIGSDNLPRVVKNIRNEIIDLGGEFMFDTKLVSLSFSNGSVTEITVNKDGKDEVIPVSEVVLAIGNGSRDTYRMLYGKGVFMEPKDTAIGFRIEHLQEDINYAQFGKDLKIPADYKLVSNKAKRGVFSFCMCPGGVVIPSQSICKTVVTNGMSEFKRDKINANSAIVCQLKTSDFNSDVLGGLDFIENIEKKAFTLTGGDYSAPVQNVTDFMNNTLSVKFGKVKPSYALGTSFVKTDDVLPAYICDSIRIGLADMNNKIRGFSESGIITSPETRTSSPVRIVRDENLLAKGLNNLYPSGEVGYAGGITSSACDGIKVAEKIKEKYSI